ncbi:MAG: hypothetical protein HYU64_19435 [Armatimonadetes bacterium]|nr:hypothetical protein [Armatimonadota bacterium]
MRCLPLLLIIAFVFFVAAEMAEGKIEFLTRCPKCSADNPKEADGSYKDLCTKCRYSLAVYPEDKGPDKVDTASFPAEMQESYKLFAARCSKCHTLARPINTRKSAAEWKTYVIKMVRKPGSGITLDVGLKVLQFLEYTQKQKK